MNKTTTAQRLLPYLIAIVSFLAACLVSFAPMIEGRELNMHDMTQYRGMSADITQHQKQYHEDPQWAGGLFSGMPAYLINVQYPSMAVAGALNTVNGLASPASLVFMAMVCFFCMCLLCGFDPRPSIVPSLAYGLSTYLFLIIGAGHMTKMVAIAYAPLMLGGMFYTFRTNKWVGAAMTALFAAIEIAANHPQITYYFLLVMVAFWINELVQAVRGKWLPRFAGITGLLALAAVLAVGANFISLYNIQKHSKYTIRGGSELTAAGDANARGLGLEYATAWSYGVGESLNMFIPDLMGGSSTGGFEKGGEVDRTLGKYGRNDLTGHLPAYWGDQPMTGGPTYVGAVVLLLAFAGLFLLRGRYKWWIVGVSAVAVMLAWGGNFMPFTKLFFNWFPGYNKFRTVAMILVIVQWAAPMLAALFLYKLWQGDTPQAGMRRALLYASYVLGGLALAVILFGGMAGFTSPVDAQLPGDVAAAMRAEREQMMRADAWRSLIFCALAFWSLWFFTASKIRKGWAVAALAVLVCADLMPVNFRYLPYDSFVSKRETRVRPSQADLQIMADSTPGYRVANMTVSTFNDATTSLFHRSVGGYHGAKLQRYQDLTDRYLSAGNRQVYDMLNTRWYIVSGEGGAPQAELNPGANGAAWFVREVRMVDTPDEEIDELGKIDTRTTAVVDRRFDEAKAAMNIPVDTAAVIELTDYRVNRLTYTYSSAVPQMAVFSEIYYPDGWTATVDGRPLEYFRADYVLRAAVLPAGGHEVVFSFRIPHFAALSAVTLGSTILILLLLGAAIYVTGFKCEKHEQGE